MTYCGYVRFLIVIIFIVVWILFVFLFGLGGIYLTNQRSLLVRLKVFNVGFFGDLEILIRIWTFLFLFIVVIISTRVLIFSFSYIRGLVVNNFIILYLSFIFSILWLTVSNNFYWIILGWDGLGVVSFLLIVIYINHESINNGLFTLFQNRVGDLFFVLFILGIINISIISSLYIKWGLVFLVLGGCVKRAQFPFNAWLLAAISAPTPISSLVHSSTLVVAGVYILLQFSYCLVDCLELLKYIRLVSLIWRTFGLLNEGDIKKLIAYSTINHVSLIMYLLRFRLFKVVYFHLNIHAIFKSLIFICFGFVILSSLHGQDKRLICLRNLSPMVKITYYFSCLCLIGLPFLRGFFSKDLIIEKLIENRVEIFFIGFLLVFLSVSIYYRLKLLNLTKIIFSYSIIEKNYIGQLRVLLIALIIVLIINVYIRLVFRLSLEVLSFKFSIYILILGFIVLSLFSNLNFKLFNYDKNKNFIEIWVLDWLSVDKFIYWNIFSVLNLVSILGDIKLFLLINWWVCFIVVGVF